MGSLQKGRKTMQFNTKKLFQTTYTANTFAGFAGVYAQVAGMYNISVDTFTLFLSDRFYGK